MTTMKERAEDVCRQLPFHNTFERALAADCFAMALRQVRDETLEAAAMVAHAELERNIDTDHRKGCCLTASKIERDVRALKEQG